MPDRLPADLDLLVVFAVVARERSFTAAARRLGVTQPSISMRVQRLEQQLGEPLFERRGRGVRLTALGETLRPTADRALALAQEANELVTGVSALSHGFVRGGASTTIAGYVLPERVARFTAAHPGVRVDIAVGNTAEITAAVERGDYAWGLVEGPVDVARLAARRFMDDELILIVPARHAWARRRSVPASALATEPFIGRESGSGTSAIYEAALAAHGVYLRPAIQLADSRGITAAVAGGAGVTIVSALVAEPFLHAKQVARVAIAGLDLRRPFTLVQLPGRTLARLDEAFLRRVAARPVR